MHIAPPAKADWITSLEMDYVNYVTALAQSEAGYSDTLTTKLGWLDRVGTSGYDDYVQEVETGSVPNHLLPVEVPRWPTMMTGIGEAVAMGPALAVIAAPGGLPKALSRVKTLESRILVSWRVWYPC